MKIIKSISTFLFLILTQNICFSQGFGPVQLEVEGDVLIKGFVDLSTEADSKSLTIGTDSGYNLTGTRFCTFIGIQAGKDHTTGNECTFIGYNSGMKNLSGDGNTFVGSSAGSNNTQGDTNSFFGRSAGSNNQTGDGNSFFGFRSGYASTGNYNSALGAYTISSNTFATGNHNSVFGHSAGQSLTSGSSNILIGSFAGHEMTTGKENTSIGYISGFAITEGRHNTFVGYGSGRNTTGGKFNVMVGFNSGLLDVDDSIHNDYNTLIGPYADFWYPNPPPQNPEIDKAIAIGYNASVGCDNCAVIGGTGVDAVNVGIGLNEPAHQLHLSTSDAAKPGGGDWINTSDKRLKKNIRNFEDGLNILMEINPVWYQYIDKFNLPSEEDFVGIIAQDMQKIAPYMIGESKHSDASQHGKYLNFDGSALKFIVVNAIQEQQNKIATLESELSELKAYVAQLIESKLLEK